MSEPRKFQDGISVRVKDINNQFYRWLGKVIEEVNIQAEDRHHMRAFHYYRVSLYGRYLELTFSEQQLELE
jgi:uncharacterized NAD(P)/FAD-binding protein YdhS